MNLHSIDYSKATIAGLVGTIAMSLSCSISVPKLGIEASNSIQLLTHILWNNQDFAWISHVTIGIVLAITYASIQKSIFGPPIIRGILFSLAPWALFQIVILPLLGFPCFMDSLQGASTSFFRHCIYGAILGGMYGK